MQVTLLTTTFSKINLGVRYISSYLRHRGYRVQIIFLRPDDESDKEMFSAAVGEQISRLAKDSVFYGISLFTLDLNEARKATDMLRASDNKPVIWGGMHAILEPEECIKYSDIVCIEEGEKAMAELLDAIERKYDYSRIEGLWVKCGAEVVKNPMRSMESDLDNYGFPDFSLEDKWIVKGGKVLPLTMDMVKESPQHFGYSHIQELFSEKIYMYVAIASRGCPHRCTYCSNAYFLDIIKGKGKPLRFKSIDCFIKELENIKISYPFLNAINIYDDDFFARPVSEIERFSDEYKKKIGLPFCCMISPWSYDARKVEILLNAGLVHAQLGVQSASERVNSEIYNRRISNKKISEVINGLDFYKKSGRLKSYMVDIILDNPYETIDDQHETLKFFAKLPQDVRTQSFSLVFYPKTALTEKALKDGIITRDDMSSGKLMSKDQNLGINNYTYYEFLMTFRRFIPSPLFKIFIKRGLFLFLKKPMFNRFFLFLHRNRKNEKIIAVWKKAIEPVFSMSFRNYKHIKINARRGVIK
ncbi:MAG: radical SAM protein [Candidatus Omnitrophota bacterium]